MYGLERIFALRALIAAAILTDLPGGTEEPSCVRIDVKFVGQSVAVCELRTHDGRFRCQAIIGAERTGTGNRKGLPTTGRTSRAH